MVIQNPKTDGFEDIVKLTEEEEDVMGVRLHTASDGKQYLIKSDGTYGLWTIHPKKGPVPEALIGQFTTPAEAAKVIAAYINKKA